MKRRFVACAALFAAMVPMIVAAVSFGGEVNLFGPESFVVGKGKPMAVTRSFSGLAGGTAMVMVSNGTGNGDNRVSTGSISVNGAEIVTPSDFNQQVGTLTRVFLLKADNDLVVTVGGRPDSLISISVTGGPGSPPPPPPPLPTASLQTDPPTIAAGETSTLSWSTTNAARVTIQPGLGEVQSSGTIQVRPAQTTVYRLVAEGPGGQATAEATVSVIPPPAQLGITFDPHGGGPLDGATVDRCELTVGGSVAVANPTEIGVTVGGIVAQVGDGRFVANNVPLSEGPNTLTAIATDADGGTWTSSAQVFCAPATQYIDMKADVVSGLAPLSVALSVDSNLAGMASSSLQCSGPASKTPIAGDDNTYTVHFDLPGLYTCRFTVRDLLGVSREKSLGIRVYSAAELNTLLKAKWAAMTDAMWDGDVDAAVAHFSPRTREVYAGEMAEMSAVLDQIVADMQGIELVALRGDKAIYDLRIVKGGIPYSFHLEFQLDEDGLWRIRAF